MTIDGAIQVSPAALSDGVAELAGRLRASVVQVHAGDRGIGSGVVWRLSEPDASGAAEATIITNAHVAMAARGASIAVKPVGAPTSGTLIPATLGAVDPSHDLAALSVRVKAATGLRQAEIGDSAALRVGELVVAVGNPFGRVGALTAGVVAARAPVDLEESAEHAEPIAPGEAPGDAPSGERWRGRGRRLETEVIQADIRLYPGNSGGPLADARGRVVGINAMVVGGLGFAIPSRTVQWFLANAERASTRPYLGVQVLTAPVSPALAQRLGLSRETAALIAGIESGSPAEAAGVLVGDILLAVNGREVAEANGLLRALARLGAAGSQPITLELLRGGERMTLALTPELRAAA